VAENEEELEERDESLVKEAYGASKAAQPAVAAALASASAAIALYCVAPGGAAETAKCYEEGEESGGEIAKAKINGVSLNNKHHLR